MIKFCEYKQDRLCQEFYCDRCEIFRVYKINLNKDTDTYNVEEE